MATLVGRFRQDGALRFLLVVALVATGLALAGGPAHAQLAPPFTFIVNSTEDEDDGILGDGDCDIAPPGMPRSGICTLRAALRETDDSPDAANRIHFGIPVTGGECRRSAREASSAPWGPFARSPSTAPPSRAAW